MAIRSRNGVNRSRDVYTLAMRSRECNDGWDNSNIFCSTTHPPETLPDAENILLRPKSHSVTTAADDVRPPSSFIKSYTSSESATLPFYYYYNNDPSTFVTTVS